MIAPVAGAYAIVAIITVPVMMKMGLTLEQGHFYALYFSTIGFLTPPVAPAALVCLSSGPSLFYEDWLGKLQIGNAMFSHSHHVLL